MSGLDSLAEGLQCCLSGWRLLNRVHNVCLSVCKYAPEFIKSINSSHLLMSVSLSQVLFATCASVPVGAFAPYAKQSGIPEIKTVLGGFVIRRFMGAWTLLVKSIGLVSRVDSRIDELSLTFPPVSGRRVGTLARQGRSAGARCVLLCKPVDEAIRYTERKRGSKERGAVRSCCGGDIGSIRISHWRCFVQSRGMTLEAAGERDSC